MYVVYVIRYNQEELSIFFVIFTGGSQHQLKKTSQVFDKFYITCKLSISKLILNPWVSVLATKILENWLFPPRDTCVLNSLSSHLCWSKARHTSFNPNYSSVLRFQLKLMRLIRPDLDQITMVAHSSYEKKTKKWEILVSRRQNSSHLQLKYALWVEGR